jgi:serine/threonine protein kinase
MSLRPNCREFAHWQALLTDSLSGDDQERFEQHLATCVACQDRLDRALEGEAALRNLARQIGDPTQAPADPTLIQVLQRLHDTKPPDPSATPEPADLYFLQPSDQPDSLGRLGEYEVSEVIGQGGMGVVLKAFDPALHRRVAIKVMAAAVAGSATARRRFTREAQAAAAVCHEHVVTVYGVAEADGLPSLVMQYVAGESLQTRLDRTGPLEVVDIVRIGMQTASGLAAAHAQGLIHRDVKPANLLLESEPRPPGSGPAPLPGGRGSEVHIKITDFGLARMVDDVALTQNDVVAGTPEYMAPEQARGEAVDHRADLFSLGSVLYALCTGRPPFRAPTALAVLRKVTDQEPAPIRSLNPDVPAWLETLINRLLAKDPAERFQTAAEVAALLEGYLAHLGQPATIPAPSLPAEDGPTARRPGGFKRLPFLLGLVILSAFPGLLLALRLAGGAGETDAGKTGQVAAQDLYQDFRAGQLPLAPWKLFGQNNAGARPEESGLRLTLPANRKQPEKIVGILSTVRLTGDFEITGTYQLLSADPPENGPGAGVSVNIASNWKSRQWGRVARVVRDDGSNVYLAGMDSSAGPARAVPTTARSGQLRLVRQGSTLHYLAAEEPGGDFRTLSWEEFNTDDIEVVRFMLNTNGSPTAVDARLVDLRIRRGNLHPQAVAALPEEGPPAGGKGWLMAAGLIGVGILFLLAVPLSLWLYVRRGRSGPLAANVAVSPVSFAWSGCGKNLKARAELAGKKVRCSGCGVAVVVPDRTATF